MNHSTAPCGDDAQTHATIDRLYEIARSDEPDSAELQRLDARIQAGLLAAYGECAP